jgi:thiol-disulfide isomerase/thioredoxin
MIYGQFLGKKEYLRHSDAAAIRRPEDAIKGYYCRVPKMYLEQLAFVDTSKAIQYSDVYSNALIVKYMYDTSAAMDAKFNLQNAFSYFEIKYTGCLRDRILINLIYSHRNSQEDISPMIDKALEHCRTPEFRAILLQLKRFRVRGATAADFELPDKEGNIHKLSDFAGKVVLLDFWTTQCGNCVRIAPFVKEVEVKFAKKDVEFVSINLDNDKSDWVRSMMSGKYVSTTITNLWANGEGNDSKVARDYNIIGWPTLILIDTQGHIMPNPLDPRVDNGKNLVELIQQGLDRRKG